MLQNEQYQVYFILVEQKEKEIRKDPLSRTSELLKKVFGSVDP